MKKEKLVYEGYKITDTETVGEKRIAIGYNAYAMKPYICVDVDDKNNFSSPRYCQDRFSALNAMEERITHEEHVLRYNLKNNNDIEL